MFRINFILFICLLSFCFSISDSFSQTLFSKIYNHTNSHTDIELLYETDENYYAIGRAQALGMQAIGLTVSCHNKKTGEVCASNIYTLENEWIFTDGKTPVFQVNNGFVFGAGFSNVLLKLKYNLDSNSVSLIDSIVNPLPGSYYLHDMIVATDTTIYHATVL
jgi:riboflavin synthase alpha subunit